LGGEGKHLIPFTMRKILLFTFLYSFLPGFAQDPKILDSLHQIIKTNSKDTNAINAYNELGIQYEYYNDSASIFNYKKALDLSYEIGYKNGVAYSFMNIGLYHFNTGSTDTALVYLKKAILIYQETAEDKGLAVCYSNLGIVYRQAGNLSKALSSFLLSLKYGEKVNYKLLIGNNKLSIGNLYRQKQNFTLAEKYYSEALITYGEEKERLSEAMAINNLGLIYSEKKQHEKALEYYFRSLKIRDSAGVQRWVANSYENIACEYNAMGDQEKALSYHNKALGIQTKINNKKGIASSLINIAAVYTAKKEYSSAIENLNKALEIAHPIKHLDMEKEIFHALSENYASINQYKLSLDHYKRYTELKDTILSQNERNELAQLQTEYDTEKKDSEIKLLNKDNEVQLAELKKKSIIIWSVLLGLLLVIILAFYIYRSYRSKQKAHDIITKQKHEVEKQKEIIEEKQKEITDSIHYAKRIQKALLASDSFLKKHLPEYFILHKPKDIVSGDFYWAAKTSEQNILVMTGDCTGHGVPGAFMSLLGVNFLNEIITDKKIIRPDLIFNQLRKEIVEALNPEGNETEGNDGMDGVLCNFDFNTGILNFASANNPLWIIRSKELLEYHSDKMPIGKYFDDSKNFKLQTIQLEKGDIVYTFTDGYADQFGGDKGKKFKYKSLQKLLLTISSLSMEEQRSELDRTIENWKGSLEQVDDILVIGVRI
jgi:serine phosphatase RsbU (regulator of sigma subunit)